MYISTIQRAERIMLAKTTMIPGATGQTFHQYIKSTAATAKLQMARHIPGRSSRTLNFHLSFGCLFLQMWMPAMAAKKRLRPIMTKNQPQVEMMGSQMAQVRWSTTMKMLWRKAILMMRSSFSLSGASLCQIECSLFIRRTITPPATPLSPIEISPIKNNKNIIILADFKSDYQRIKIKVIIGIIEQLFLNYPAKLYIMTKITQLTDFVCFQLHDGLRIKHQGFKDQFGFTSVAVSVKQFHLAVAPSQPSNLTNFPQVQAGRSHYFGSFSSSNFPSALTNAMVQPTVSTVSEGSLTLQMGHLALQISLLIFFSPQPSQDHTLFSNTLQG